jgi:hypothetical protein
LPLLYIKGPKAVQLTSAHLFSGTTLMRTIHPTMRSLCGKRLTSGHILTKWHQTSPGRRGSLTRAGSSKGGWNRSCASCILPQLTYIDIPNDGT